MPTLKPLPKTTVINIQPNLNLRISRPPTKEEAAIYTRGWVPTSIEWSREHEPAIKDFFQYNCIVSATLKEGYRSKNNIIYLTCIILDFDNGVVSLDDFMTKATRDFHFCWMLYTTVSHNKIKPDDPTQTPMNRFHVIIPLATPVSETEFETLIIEIKKTFPGAIDPSSFTGSQYFYGNPNSEFSYVHFATTNIISSEGEITEDEEYVFLPPPAATNNLSSKKISTLNLKKYNEKVHPAPSTTPTTPTSGNTIYDGYKDSKQVVQLKDGTHSTVIELQQELKTEASKIEVLCPYCDPKNRNNPDKANAFISCNYMGHVYLSCSSEHMTFWYDPSETQVISLIKIIFAETVKKYVRYDGNGEFYLFNEVRDEIEYCNWRGISHKMFRQSPRVKITFDPTLESGYIPNPQDRKEIGLFNTFSKTRYMTKNRSSMTPIPLQYSYQCIKQKSPHIAFILLNMLEKEEYVIHFLNWLASLFQTRRKQHTSWVISTHPGSGKGIFYERVLRHIFGIYQSDLLAGQDIGEKFNGTVFNKILLIFDEVFTKQSNMIDNKTKELLKSQITNDKLGVEFKGKDKMMVPNVVNIIVYSNSMLPIPIDPRDRRYNVIRNNNSVLLDDQPFFKDKESFGELISAEVDAFADIIAMIEIDKFKAGKTLDTPFKQKLQRQSIDPFALFAGHINTGNVEELYLNEVFRPTDVEAEIKSGDTYIRDEAKLCADLIQNHHCIPIKYLDDFAAFFFKVDAHKFITQREIYERLKIHDLIPASTKRGNYKGRLLIFKDKEKTND